MRFTRDHQWIELDGGVAVVGLTAYAAEQLGDVVEVALPARGKALKTGDTMAEVEGERATTQLPAPIDGEVVEINADLFETPDLVNAGPETLAWFARLKPSDPAQIEALMDRGAYEAYLDSL